MTVSFAAEMRLEFTKWDGRLHWHFDVDLLGEDDYGTWVGVPKGRLLRRGNEQTATSFGFVCLVPKVGGWIATFYRQGAHEVAVYVDITSVPARDGDIFRAVDLDLDVIAGGTAALSSTTKTSSPSTKCCSATPLMSSPPRKRRRVNSSPPSPTARNRSARRQRAGSRCLPKRRRPAGRRRGRRHRPGSCPRGGRVGRARRASGRRRRTT